MELVTEECLRTFRETFENLYQHQPQYKLIPRINRQTIPISKEYSDLYSRYMYMRASRLVSNRTYFHSTVYLNLSVLDCIGPQGTIVGQIQYVYIPGQQCILFVGFLFNNPAILQDTPELLKIIDTAASIFSREHAPVKRYLVQLPWPDDEYKQHDSDLVHKEIRRIEDTFKGLKVTSVEFAYTDYHEIPTESDLIDDVIAIDYTESDDKGNPLDQWKCDIRRTSSFHHVVLALDQATSYEVAEFEYYTGGDYPLITFFAIDSYIDTEEARKYFRLLVHELFCIRSPVVGVAYRIAPDFIHQVYNLVPTSTIYLANILRTF